MILLHRHMLKRNNLVNLWFPITMYICQRDYNIIDHNNINTKQKLILHHNQVLPRRFITMKCPGSFCTSRYFRTITFWFKKRLTRLQAISISGKNTGNRSFGKIIGFDPKPGKKKHVRSEIFMGWDVEVTSKPSLIHETMKLILFGREHITTNHFPAKIKFTSNWQ